MLLSFLLGTLINSLLLSASVYPLTRIALLL